MLNRGNLFQKKRRHADFFLKPSRYPLHLFKMFFRGTGEPKIVVGCIIRHHDSRVSNQEHKNVFRVTYLLYMDKDVQ